MKIKSSNTALGIKPLPSVMLICSFAAIVLRSLQIVKFIDPTTGFYTTSNILIPVLFILLYGSCAVFMIISYLSAQSSKIEIPGIKNMTLCVVTYIFVVSLAIDTIVSFVSSVSGMFSSEGFSGLMSTGVLPKLLQSIFGVLSTIYMVTLATCFRTGARKMVDHKLLAVAPAGWVSFRMLSLFVSKISFIRISDLFLELTMLAFMALFFMAFAQVASGVYSTGTGWRLPAFGLSSALLAACISIPRLIFTFVDKKKYINSGYPFKIVDLAFFVFAVVLVFIITYRIDSTDMAQINQFSTDSVKTEDSQLKDDLV